MGPGDVVQGRYRVERRVGSSDRSIVFAAEDEAERRAVAIKLLRPSVASDDDALLRFRNEARLAREIEGEAAVQLLDEGTAEGAPFHVMELLEGVQLDAFVAADRRLPVPVAVHVIVRACRAIEAAHARGVVHRNVRPRAFFVTRTARGPALRLLHFGVERPGAPRGQYAHARADRWALGAALYALLTDVDPFDGNPSSAAFSGAGAELAPVAELEPTLPPGLAAVVSRCLAPKPADRYPTAGAIADALAPFADESAFHSFPFFDHLPPPSRPSAPSAPAAEEPRSWALPALAASGLVIVAAIIAAVVNR